MNKQDFPIFRAHPDLVYLDTAATAQKPQVVIDAISYFYANENANIHRGLYKLSEAATEKYDAGRERVTSFIGAKSDEIVFVRNATEGINLVMYAWAQDNVSAGDSIVVSVMEHHSNFVPWYDLCERSGAELKVAGLNSEGYVSADEVIAQIDDTTKLVCITHLSNALGVKLDVQKVCEAAKKVGAKVLVDAAQSVVHSKIDVEAIGCDFLVLSGHKLYGPTGIGVLYSRAGLLTNARPFLYGGDMIKSVSIDEVLYADLPDRYEAGTPHIAGVVGLYAAIDYVESVGLDKIEEHDCELCEYAIAKLKELDFVEVVSPVCATSAVSFVVKGVHAHDVSQILSDENVAVRGGHHCTQPLHKELGLVSTVRMSFGLYNEKEDVDKAIESLNKVNRVFNE